MNLLKETIEVLKDNDKTPADVVWVGSEDMWFNWEHFASVSDFTYNPGFGAQEVARDLVVVGKDFWLEREEYDGAEKWAFKSLPIKPKTMFKVKTVGKGSSYMWESLKDMRGNNPKTLSQTKGDTDD